MTFSADSSKPQAAPTNVIGIGKWAHTSTGQAPVPVNATPTKPATPAKGMSQLDTADSSRDDNSQPDDRVHTDHPSREPSNTAFRR